MGWVGIVFQVNFLKVEIMYSYVQPTVSQGCLIDNDAVFRRVFFYFIDPLFQRLRCFFKPVTILLFLPFS